MGGVSCALLQLLYNAAEETMLTSSASRLARVLAVRFISDDSGQDLIEYALLTAIIGVSAVLIFPVLSTTMGAAYSSWNTAGQNAWQPCPPQPAACP
jgi:Flp pilus assembly pilin Flp